MKTLKTININGNNFALPEGMSAKDIQALAGFLCTLSEVGREYDYDTGESIHFETLASSVILPRKQRNEAMAGYAAQYAQALTALLKRSPYDWFNFFPFWEQGVAARPASSA